jgi:hypothetical protein
MTEQDFLALFANDQRPTVRIVVDVQDKGEEAEEEEEEEDDEEEG